MPRPPTKRNRMVSKTSSVPQDAPQPPQTLAHDVASEKVTRSPESNARDVGSSTGAQRLEIARQLKNQTPMTKSHEQAIESSPMGEHGATGSRPPTRSRGYSSTLSIAGRKGDMSSKIPGTPALESSVLSNFRRRPRQPSILQMMQAEDGSSDLDDDDFLGGLSPEDESTPLNLSRGKSLLTRNDSSPPPSEPQLPSSGSSRKRKRSSGEIQVPRSPLAVVGDSRIGSPTSEIEDGTRGRSSSPELPPYSEAPDVFSQTMAPPMSSPLSSPTQSTVIPDLSKQPGAPEESGEEHAGQKTKSKSFLSTANLQDRLLPRRRQQQQRKRRHAANFEMPSDSSGSESDQDELSYVPSRPERSQQKRATRPKLALDTQRKTARQRTTKAVAQQDGATKNPTAQLGSDVSGAKSSKPKITPLSIPGGDTAVDKENEPGDSSPLSSPLDTDAFESDLPSEPSSPAVKYLSEEIRLQARKFAEVDAWQMDFEDVPGSQA